MADTKISALTAAGGAADANELAINEAGTSKKLTALQLKTYANTANVFAAGSATAASWPVFTTGAKLTTPEAGAVEFENELLLFGCAAGKRGTVQVEQWISQVASRTTGNNTNVQK